MNNKLKILLITIISIIIIIPIILITIYIYDNSTFNIREFEHKDTTLLNYNSRETCSRYDNNKSVYDGGKYFSGKIPYQNGEIIIEENVIHNKQDDDFNQFVKSVIYSKHEVNRDLAEDYVDCVHDGVGCGVYLHKYKQINNHYAQLYYEVPHEC